MQRQVFYFSELFRLHVNDGGQADQFEKLQFAQDRGLGVGNFSKSILRKAMCECARGFVRVAQPVL